jgi:hypothetical protein
MLILELLFMDSVLPAEDPPQQWDREGLLQLHAAWQASCDSPRRQALAHLKVPEVFSLSEQQRPTSTQLAAGLGLELPEGPVICTDAQIAHLPSALPRIRSVSAYVQQRPRRPPTAARARQQSRQAAPSQTQSLSPWLVPAQVVTRKLRRPQNSVFSRSQRDDLKLLVLAMIAIYAIISLVFFSTSCHKTPAIGQPAKSEIHKKEEKGNRPRRLAPGTTRMAPPFRRPAQPTLPVGYFGQGSVVLWESLQVTTTEPS